MSGMGDDKKAIRILFKAAMSQKKHQLKRPREPKRHLTGIKINFGLIFHFIFNILCRTLCLILDQLYRIGKT